MQLMFALPHKLARVPFWRRWEERAIKTWPKIHI